jgi:putative chitinase
MRQLTEALLYAIYPYADIDRVRTFLPWLNMAMAAAEIVTPQRQAAFLAQIGHESGQLRYVREIYSGERYDVGDLAERLGNTPEDDDDGERYRGRGLIQITGKANYAACSRAIFGDESLLLEYPEMLEEPKYACVSAAWFWQSRGLNALADKGDFVTITKKINGGLNGLKDREALWACAKMYLA